MQSLLQDLRFGTRTLLINPGFSFIAIMTLALGIGGNTAIFSVVNAALLRPLPYAESARLALIKEDWPAKDIPDFGASMPDFLEWRNRNKVFERLEAFSTEACDISTNDDPERVEGVMISAELLPLLGATPKQGRGFLSEEQQFGKHRVVILSDALWRRRFGDQAKLNGQIVKVDGEPFTVVGVMPRGFEFPDHKTELWRPLSVPDGHENKTRNENWLEVIARLKPGVTIKQAQAEMDNIHGQLAREFKETAEFRERVLSLIDSVVGKELKIILLVLLGAVGFVLLIACANIANLMLGRAISRRKEMAIRAALGASQWRIIRQLLTESILIGLTGGSLGLLVATWGMKALLRLGPDLPRFAGTKIDGRVLLFTITLSLLTSLFVGIAPAWQSTKIDLQESLKESARSASRSLRSRHLLSTLVISEIALSLVLLICAGLMINSLLRLQRVDPGFRTSKILSMRISLPVRMYPETKGTTIVDFYQLLEQRVRAFPGVEQVGYTTSLPLAMAGWLRYFTIEGHPIAKSLEETPLVHYRQISAHYFETLGIRLLKGRPLNEHDTRETTPSAVVNESFAKHFFPNEDPLGQRFYLGYPEELSPPTSKRTRWTIVGVVRDLRHQGLSAPPKPEIFSLHEQSLAKSDDGPDPRMFLVVRTTHDPMALAGAIRREVLRLDKELPVTEVMTMDQLLDNSLVQQRFISLLLFIFSLIALILTAVGIYGVVSYSTAQRTHEIGIRMALGGQKADILKLVVGQGMRLTLIGLMIGLIGSFAVTRFIKTLLFEVQTSDPLTYGAVTLLILSISTFACYLPARRALKIDPMTALRND